MRIAAVALLALLVGCEVRVEFRIRDDGTGSMTQTVVVTPAMRSWGQTTAKLKAKMLADKNYQRPGVEITDGKLPDGNEYVKALVPFQNISGLSDKESQFEFEPVEGTRRRMFRMRDRSLARAGAAMMDISVQTELPGTITRPNADSVTGSTARWSNASLIAKATSAEGIFAECELSPFSLDLSVVVIAGVFAAGLLLPAYFYWRKKSDPEPVAAVEVEADTIALPGAVTYCGECRAQNRSTAKFCSRCGSGL